MKKYIDFNSRAYERENIVAMLYYQYYNTYKMEDWILSEKHIVYLHCISLLMDQ